MNSDEFWCRAFLAAMGGNYAQEDPGPDHASNARHCERAADAALAVASRRGHLDGTERAPVERPDPTAIEFTAERDGDLWMLRGWELGSDGITVHSEQLTYPLGDGVVAHIAWGETCPPKPIEVRLVRSEGA